MRWGIVKSIYEGVIKRFSADGHTDETIEDREYVQHYGLTSRPLPGAEVVIINEGNNYVAIASDDRRYRIGIEEGEVCIYTDEGDHIRFKRSKEIYVKSGNKLTAEIENEITATTKRAVISASESCQVNSPSISLVGDVAITGNLTVTESISATGSIIDGGGNTNHHSHG